MLLSISNVFLVYTQPSSPRHKDKKASTANGGWGYGSVRAEINGHVLGMEQWST